MIAPKRSRLVGVLYRALPAFSAVSAQLALLGVQVIITPVLLSTIGESGYGTYSVLIAAYALVLAMDLGIGNALVTHVARRDIANTDLAELLAPARRVLRRLAMFACAMGGILVLVSQVPGNPWPSLGGLGWVLAAGGLTLPFSITPRIRVALGQVGVSSAWAIAGALAGGFMAIAIALAGGNPVACFLAVAVGRVLGLAGDWYSLPQESRRPKVATGHPAGQSVLADGRQFWALQLAAAISYNIDVIVVGVVVGSAEAGTLAIVLRIVMLVPLFLGVALQPSWRTFAQSTSRHELRRQLFRATAVVGVLAGCVISAIVVGRDAILSLWLGPDAPEIPTPMWIAVGVWAFMASVTGPVGVFFNALRILRPQLIVAIVATTLNLTLSCFLAWMIGSVGPVLASILIQGLVVWPSSAVIARRTLRLPI